MSFEGYLVTFAAILFFGMIVMLEIGRRVGNVKKKQDPEGFEKGIGAVDGAVFGLLGLMIALTFAGAATRFESRRHLVTEEANDVGTAYLRIDLMAKEHQPEMRQLFRSYLDARIETYRNSDDLKKAMQIYDQSIVIQGQIWKKAVANCQAVDAAADACKLFLPSVNDMIDISTTRLMSTKIHPPQVIYILMGILSLLGALLAGYGMSGNKSRNILHMIAFSLVMSVTIYVILDIEYPRRGLIRVDNADQVLIDLRKSMN